ncbi:hypothetical protein [Nigerium massiliense]|uniref:hypothetical protein n=1 Tax=Nigerium massiliense TaxID=1522317 RepID=UPI00058E9CEB|nr:hypothetical protein [Nigerium massiliense]
MPRPPLLPTARGVLFGSLGAALVAAAFALPEAALVVPGVLLLVLPLVSWLTMLLGRRGLTVSRRLDPPQVEAGQQLDVELDVGTRRGAVPAGLFFEDELPPSFGEKTFLPAPDEPARRARVRYRCRPRRRGRFRLDRLRAGQQLDVELDVGTRRGRQR